MDFTDLCVMGQKNCKYCFLFPGFINCMQWYVLVQVNSYFYYESEKHMNVKIIWDIDELQIVYCKVYERFFSSNLHPSLITFPMS